MCIEGGAERTTRARSLVSHARLDDDSPPSVPEPTTRIGFLDGLRGVAIAGVMLFHAYGIQFSAFHPFGERYGHVYPVQYGWAGVQLFFLISGFVILMTLEKSRGLLDFAKRRWLRLFPAMFVGSLVLLAFDHLFAAGPTADRGLVNLLPGWLFISPPVLHMITRHQIESMDGTFWSLYVEVCFYVIVSLSYFRLGTARTIALVFSIFVVSVAAGRLAAAGVGGSGFHHVADCLGWMGFLDFGWFASGALFYLDFRRPDRRVFVLAIAVAVLSALDAYPPETGNIVALLGVVVAFASIFKSKRLQAMLELRPLTFLGFVSYPLYLIHSNIVIGSSFLLGRYVPAKFAALTPVPPIVAVTAVSWVIARYIEPAVRRRKKGTGQDGLRVASVA
jgi:peptidoglycan/LPS O-acetylase OafA/YrhL